MTVFSHTPVLVNEILSHFKPKGTDRLLDCTLGLGGHTKAYLVAGGDKVTAVGIEADGQALKEAQKNLAGFKDRVSTIQGNYVQVKDFITGGGILYPPMFTHILLDVGVGSHQLSDTSRGFSFQAGTSLVMKYGKQDKLPDAAVPALNVLAKKLGTYPEAQDIIAHLSVDDLTQVIRHYGEEKYAHRIAQAIVAQREAEAPFLAQQLAAVISAAVPANYERGRIHPATRTFQALRLGVNRELEVLAATLPQLVEILDPQGQLAVISFHSLEDRIVKNFFRQEAKGCTCPPESPTCVCGKNPRLKVVTKKPITASDGEIASNPRARSAKLRIAIRAPDSA